MQSQISVLLKYFVMRVIKRGSAKSVDRSRVGLQELFTNQDVVDPAPIWMVTFWAWCLAVAVNYFISVAVFTLSKNLLLLKILLDRI